MENKFNINSEEVKRILFLHEDATKNQYLNVISEQAGGLDKTNGQYKIPNDVVVYPRPGESAKPKSFTIKTTSVIYPNYKNNSVIIQGVINNDTKKPADKNLKLTCGTGELEYGDNTARFYGKDSQIIKTLSSTYCDGNKLKNWNVLLGKEEKRIIQKQKTQLTPQQRRQQFIQQVQQNNTQIQTSLGIQQPTGQITTNDIDTIMTILDNKVQQGQPQFVQQVQQNNTQIQTSLGGQQPTSQITTADIDAIMNKIG